MAEMRNVHKILVEKLEGKRQLVRLRRRWEDNIKTDFREIECEVVVSMRLAQDRAGFLNTVMKF